MIPMGAKTRLAKHNTASAAALSHRGRLPGLFPYSLLAEGRIPFRRAAVIACVDSPILRTLPAMQREGGKLPIIFDAPRPERDPSIPPEASQPNPGSGELAHRS